MSEGKKGGREEEGEEGEEVVNSFAISSKTLIAA
jgi:hypothetical protein